MDMVTVHINQLMQLCLDRKAENLFLYPGQPPRAWIDGALQELSARKLEQAECEVMMKTITPSAHQRQLAADGGTEFEFPFGDRARFSASVFYHEGRTSIDLRLVFRR